MGPTLAEERATNPFLRAADDDTKARVGMAGVRFAGFRFGNLNTPADLAAAGVELPSAR